MAIVTCRHIHEFSADDRELVVRAINMLATIYEVTMTVSAQVQQVLDLAKSNTTVVASVDAGMKALMLQVTDLKNQIATQTPSLSDDDKAALTSTATELQNSISTLSADIPTGTPQAPSAPPPVQVPPDTTVPGTGTTPSP